MKKLYIFFAILIMIILVPQIAFGAGSASISAPASVESGSNVTIKVTLSNVAAWNIKIKASGATDGATKSYADATEDAENTTKTFSVTCNSKGAGTITVTVTGDITSADGANKDISLTKAITVKEKQVNNSTNNNPSQPTNPPTSGTTSKPNTPSSGGQTSSGQTTGGQTSSGQTTGGQTSSGQTTGGQTSSGQTTGGQTQNGQTTNENVKKEAEARLAELSVLGYEISPAFNKDTQEYFVEVPLTQENVTIDAKTLGSKAQIQGTGNYEVKEGNNVFEIAVTAENGETKTYKLNVAVVDKNPIIATINQKQYTVVKQAKLLKKPNLYEETTIKINDIEVPAFKNETNKLIIVGIKDENNQILYATYNDGKYDIYTEVTSKNLLLYITEGKLERYKKTSVTINEKQYSAYEINDRFVVVYAMNVNNGEYGYYKYDKKDETFQYYEIDKAEQKEINVFAVISVILGILLVISIIVQIVINKKKLKIENI